MRIDRTAMHGLMLAAMITGAAAARADNAATGIWIDHTGRGGVEITECGGNLCGHVAWLQDGKNASQCGKQIIGDVKPVGKGKWDNGWIYDPDSDSRYDVEVTSTGADTLKVVGYAGTKWLSKSFTWKRAPADLQKCADTDERAADAKPEAGKSPAAAAAGTTKPSSESAKADIDSNATRAGAAADVTNDAAKAPAGETAAEKNETAKAQDRSEDDYASDEADEPRGGKRIVSRIMERLEQGDTPVKVTRKGTTCKMSVPYVDMVITIPCED